MWLFERRRVKRAQADTGSFSFKYDVLPALMVAVTAFLLVQDKGNSWTEIIIPAIAGVAMLPIAHAAHFGWNLWRAGERLLLEDERAARERLETELAEARHQLQVFQRPRLGVTVSPLTRQRSFGFEDEHAKAAYLEVVNTSEMALADVEVRIVRMLTLLEKQDNPCAYVLTDLLGWTPTPVYWSVKEQAPPVLRMPIAHGSSRVALVAFSDDSQSKMATFNTPGVKPQFDQCKLAIEVAGNQEILWKGEMYLECHPKYTDGTGQHIEFLDWDRWCVEHPLRVLYQLEQRGLRIQSRMAFPRPKGMASITGQELDRHDAAITEWVKLVEACLGGDQELDTLLFRNDIGVDSAYKPEQSEGLEKQLLVMKQYVDRRLRRLDEIIERRRG